MKKSFLINMRDFRGLVWGCQGALLLAVPAFCADRGQPPVFDSLRISAFSLFKVEAPRAGEAAGEGIKVAKAKLPSSAALYLKPSGMVNSQHPRVQKAAQEALRPLAAGGAGALRDPGLLAKAVRAWVEGHIKDPAPGEGAGDFAADPRLRNPKANEILQRGWGDAEGRARLRLALLRALGVPARSCRFRGGPALQYWEQLLRDEPDDKAPLGRWVLDEAAFPGEQVEAWSLDPGELALASWEPAQEMRLGLQSEGAWYPLSETAQAMADLEWAKANGRLPAQAQARALPPRPKAGDKGSLLWLQSCEYLFEAEGTIEALEPLELFVPYRASLKQWGKEEAPAVAAFEILSQGLWTDRPGRLRQRRKSDFLDEWKSPPPGIGMLHFFSLGTGRPLPLIAASASPGQVQGKVLREDSLAPMEGANVSVDYASGTLTARLEGTTGPDGLFQIKVPEGLEGWLSVKAGQGTYHIQRWDELKVEARP